MALESFGKAQFYNTALVQVSRQALSCFIVRPSDYTTNRICSLLGFPNFPLGGNLDPLSSVVKFGPRCHHTTPTYGNRRTACHICGPECYFVQPCVLDDKYYSQTWQLTHIWQTLKYAEKCVPKSAIFCHVRRLEYQIISKGDNLRMLDADLLLQISLNLIFCNIKFLTTSKHRYTFDF